MPDDFWGIGKILPIDKLIDVISNVVGRLSKQYFDKKDIQTRAYEIRAIANARADEMKIIAEAVKENQPSPIAIEYKDDKVQISSNPELPVVSKFAELPSTSLGDRVDDRVFQQEARRQLNIENVTAIAAEQLKDDPPIENTPVNDDWMARFFNIVQDISNEEMQALWGKILAGEVKRPKSFSLRTMELIKNLSKDEADVIMKVGNFSFRKDDDYAIFKGDDGLEKHGITFYDTALLIELGIIQPNELMYTFDQVPYDTIIPILYGDYVFRINRPANTAGQILPIYYFTQAGKEILSLLTTASSFEYMLEMAKYLKKDTVTCQYAEVIRNYDGKLDYGDWKEFEGE